MGSGLKAARQVVRVVRFVMGVRAGGSGSRKAEELDMSQLFIIPIKSVPKP